MTDAKHRITWAKGTRRAAAARMQYQDKHGNSWDITLQPLQCFYMLGIGYNHSEWGHAYWKGELETGREDWDFADINPLDYAFLHNHQVVKATMTDSAGSRKEGIGTLESIVIGRHDPSGFKEFFDGAQ